MKSKSTFKKKREKKEALFSDSTSDSETEFKPKSRKVMAEKLAKHFYKKVKTAKKTIIHDNM